MLATRIPNHVQLAFARFMEQYKQIPTQYTLPLVDGTTLPTSAFSTVVGVQVNQVQELENALFALDRGRQFFDGTTFPAIGAQLDGIGEIVGITRNGLTDAEYLIFILGTIAENNSDGTTAAVLNIASLLFQVTELVNFELFPAEFDLQIPDTTVLEPELFPVAANIIHNALGAGVGLGFISLYPAATPTSSFRFTRVGGPPVGGGFSRVSDPTNGGGFARNIYSSVGA